MGGEAINRNGMLKIVIAVRKVKVEQGQGDYGVGRRAGVELG